MSHTADRVNRLQVAISSLNDSILMPMMEPRAKQVGDDESSEQLAELLGMKPAPKDRIGHIIDGRYEVLAELGRGGFGVVYRARQLNVGREVALKLLHASRTRDPHASSRFEREMETTARLEHPNIVRLYDVGVSDDGDLYMAMHLLTGESLEQVLHHTDLTWSRVVNIAIQVTRALQAAHEQGIVHRDLKPSNVMLRDVPGQKDVVSVLDFGLAAYANRHRGDKKITDTGVRLGTPTYCAPEQAQTATVDIRADLYSLGVMLYQMVVGAPPFEAATPVALMYEHAHTAPIPPNQRDAKMHVPPELERLILDLLQKAPDKRPTDPGAVLERLEAMLKPPAPPKVTAGMSQAIKLAAGAVVLAVIALIVGFVAGGRRAEKKTAASAIAAVTATGSPGDLPVIRDSTGRQVAAPKTEVAARATDRALDEDAGAPKVGLDDKGMTVTATLAPALKRKEPEGAAATLKLPLAKVYCHLAVLTNHSRSLRVVWLKEGREDATRDVKVRPSRRYRTWGKFYPTEPGRYTCQVFNDKGVLLATSGVTLVGP